MILQSKKAILNLTFCVRVYFPQFGDFILSDDGNISPKVGVPSLLHFQIHLNILQQVFQVGYGQPLRARTRHIFH